jgi:Protein of unknown function (DUF3341)
VSTVNDTKLYGLLAEYDTADGLIDAIKAAKEAGYSKLDGYSPYAVAGIADALGFKYSEMSTVMICGGLLGAACGFFMQAYTASEYYPMNVGGRPMISWPSFIPITFETGILTCALSGVFGLLAICGLPRPNHPLFGVEKFGEATRDKFFLTVEATDPKFDLAATKAFLGGLKPLSVLEVPA